ncbi:Nif11-like leader peptide family natural product precursor [Synechococcus sp. UW140]|uniref:Nif11-like leader peptide family natural product precursor n=1 Tax=Synechococcus sp. UW140 TaxID=368503 RepID=UPI0025D7F1C6|nr:Nif11-like leader peptide family natural product precursor [Synechococcus sp. UW140]
MLFSRELVLNPQLSLLVSQAKSPAEIVEIAINAGFVFTVEDLRVWSKELSNPCYPWAGLGREWRHNFFKQK